MQNQHAPVLIIAQSARFLAQSATQTGYRVWVADCFGDQDTLHAAERWQQLTTLFSLTENTVLKTLADISQGEECLLIYGSGIEQYYPVLDKLPANIKLLGNTAACITIIKTPLSFFLLLQQLELPYPSTQFEQPADDDWLIKSYSGFGGSHIQHLNRKHQITDNIYFQRYIQGISGSVLFIADGKQAQILRINQQYLQENADYPFRLGGIISPWNISEQHHNQLKMAIDKITFATQLVGINSIDFIISEQDKLQLLEVNPRISASAELLNSKTPLFQHHLNACNGKLPEKQIEQDIMPSMLSYLYAEYDLIIPTTIEWPLECHDIPAKDEKILSGEPICTILNHAESNEVMLQQHNNIVQQILLQINTLN